MAVPAVTPVTVPEVFTVATAVFVLLHVPPGTPSVNEIVLPIQSEPPAGEIGPAPGLTVTVAVEIHVPLV